MPGKEIKGRSKIANYRHGGRTDFSRGGGSAPFLRGRSGSSNIKAPRGSEGWKQMQKAEAKLPKTKTKRPTEDREQISSKKAISILKQHGHKSKVKGDKIKAVYQEGKGGVFKTKVETLPKNPTLARVKDFLGYKKGGKV